MTDEFQSQTPSLSAVPSEAKATLFAVRNPFEWKPGTFLVQVYSEDKSTLLYECLDFYPNWAFNKAMAWIEFQNRDFIK